MASGRPDWFGTIVAAGKYDTTFIPIGLDETGAILALMKGAYDSALKTIAVDDVGVMKANLSAQDLDFLTVRPAYGGALRKEGTKFVPDDTVTELFSISGRGTIYGGVIWVTSATTRKYDFVYMIVDGVSIQRWQFLTLHNRRIFPGVLNPTVLCEYDDDNFKYTVAFGTQITFETSFSMSIYQSSGETQTYRWDLVYALIP